jgi:hypothetical protein
LNTSIAKRAAKTIMSTPDPQVFLLLFAI